jgi:hypothetical protein
MNVISVDKDHALLSLSSDDLALLCQAINESIEALDDWDYPIRMGFSIEEARALQDQLLSVSRQLT